MTVLSTTVTSIRTFFLATVFATITLSFGTVCAQQPNILLVMCDDVGTESFECYFANPRNTHDGNASIETPHITALADSGLLFTRAFSQPLCTPSRVQIMTGQYNYRNYRSFAYLDNNLTTFGHVLRDHGYITAIAGKWQLSDPISGQVAPDGPSGIIIPDVVPWVMRNDYGFDHFQLWQLNVKGNRYWSPIQQTASSDGRMTETLSSTSSDYGPDRQVAFLKDFMTDATAAGTPFLAYFPLELPHNPFVSTPNSSSGQGSNSSNKAFFDDNIEYIDTIVGDLVDYLEDPDGDPMTSDSIREDTLFIFTSDNGTNRGITVVNNSGTVTGEKAHPTNYGTHVPFIVSWPGTVAPGTTSERPVDFTDVFATMLEVADISPNGLGLDGIPVINADGTPNNDRQIAYIWYDSMGKGWPLNQCAIGPRYKLYANGSLYDLLDDPSESNDLSSNPPPEALAALPALQSVLDFHPGNNGVLPSALTPDDPSVAPFLQLALTDCANTFDPATGQWLDYSGHGRHANPVGLVDVQTPVTYVAPTPTTIPASPFYLADLSALHFDSATDDLLCSLNLNADLGMDELTMFSVYRITSTGGDSETTRPVGIGSMAATQAASANEFNLASDPSIRGSVHDFGPSNYELSIPLDSVVIRITRMDSNGVDEWFNTAAHLSPAATDMGVQYTTSVDEFYLGDLRAGVSEVLGITNEADFDLVEVLVYNTALTDDQISGINQWLASNLGAPLPNTPAPYGFDLTVKDAGDGTNVVLTWQSRPGMVYNVLSNQDLSTPPSTWPVLRNAVPADPPLNSLIIPRPPEVRSFFVIEELPAAP